MSAEPTDAAIDDRNRLLLESGSADPAATSTCGTCLQPMVRSGSEDVCVRCLASFLAAPDESGSGGPESVRPAELKTARYGHFEILTDEAGLPQELGRGSMGATYRARDTVLHRLVALKVIERSVAELPAARQRFLREARAAAQFQHPGVAAVSHYGEQDGECFYVMELVEGETLEARVRREGPLPAALTLEIASQITQALVAAEALGVIHRDLKPSNLMLLTRRGGEGGGDGAPLVKVIDFGLAKAVDAAAHADGSSDTRAGFIGTPAFASPEQFAYERDGRLDHRSDIYSLGATLWYTLSGQVPFSGRTLAEIQARQSGRLPVEHLTARTVPAPVIALLESTLAADPAARPQSAKELLDALRRCQTQVLAVSHRGQRGQRPRLTAALVLFAVAAIGVGVWRWHSNAEKGADAHSIAVLTFENLSPNPDDAFFTTGVQDEINANLAHIAALKVIGPDSTRGYPPGQRDFARIGRELGVSRLLEGSVRREGGNVHVTLRLIDPREPTHVWTSVYNRQLPDIFVVQSEITRAIAERLQTPLSAEEKNAVNEPPTTDLAAYDLYLRAREIPDLATNIPEMFASLNKGIVLLEAALARDPDFVLAHCGLAESYDSFYSYRRYFTPEQRMVDYRALAESELQKARRLRPDAGEVHLAAAQHFYHANQDHEQARIEIELARRTLPNSAELEALAGSIHRTQDRWDEAVRCLQRAVLLEPRGTIYWSELGSTYHLMRRWDDFERTTAAVMALLPAKNAAEYNYRPTISLERDADLAPLRAELALSAEERPPGYSDDNLLTLHLFEHDADALSRAVAALTHPTLIVYGFVYPKEWYGGLAARMRGDDVGARRAFAAARLEAEKTTTANATDALNLSVLAMIDAGLGRTGDAVREGRRACELRPPQEWATQAPLVGSNLAVVYAWTGQPDLAIATLQELVRRPSGQNSQIQPSYGDLRLNPTWDSLRGDKRFEALVEQLAPRPPVGTAGK